MNHKPIRKPDCLFAQQTDGRFACLVARARIGCVFKDTTFCTKPVMEEKAMKTEKAGSETMKAAINHERSVCALELRRLIKLGYKIIGSYGRDADYLYLRRAIDRCAMPFCLDDPTFNRTMKTEAIKKAGG